MPTTFKRVWEKYNAAYETAWNKYLAANGGEYASAVLRATVTRMEVVRDADLAYLTAMAKAKEEADRYIEEANREYSIGFLDN